MEIMRRPSVCFLKKDIAAAAPGINHPSPAGRAISERGGGRKRRKKKRKEGPSYKFSPTIALPLPSLPFPSRVINTPFFLPPHSGCPSRTSPRPSFPDLPPPPSLSLSLSLAGYLVLATANARECTVELSQLSRLIDARTTGPRSP